MGITGSVVKDTNYENEDKIMSDDEYDRMSQTSQTSMKGDEAFAKRKAGVQKNELNEQLKEYINQWREERQKEEGELKRLKEKQAKRKEIRAEQEKAMAKKKKEEEDKLRKEEAEKKAIEAAAKKKEMLAAQKEKGGKQSAGPAMDAHKELAKTKEQVEEECKISLNIRIKPLPLNEMDSDELRNKANQIWNTIVELETDKYDYEQRHKDQDYEFKELKERQKLQQRNKAIKKGLDPEAFTGAHPPTIHMFSKYERRTDTRTYGDKKKLYEGGAEVLRSEALELAWKEKFNEWQKRPKAKLPKWFGVRPGKKEGVPDTPEGEEDAVEEANEEEEEYDEEEEEEEEEE